MTEERELSDKVSELIATMKEVTNRKEAKKADGAVGGPEADGLQELAAKAAAYDAMLLSAKQDRALADKHEADADQEERIAAAVKAALKSTRAPSIAAIIGQGPAPKPLDGGRFIAGVGHRAAPGDEGSIPRLRGGRVPARPPELQGHRPRRHQLRCHQRRQGCARVLGVRWAQPGDLATAGYGMGVHQMGDIVNKATLGTTDATGGYVLPNNFVDTLIKPPTQRAVLQNLVTVRNGVNVRGVDQPYRTGTPTRMTFQDWGSTKTNVNEAYSSYTANLGTLGAHLRHQQAVRAVLRGICRAGCHGRAGKAAVLGENYYMHRRAPVTGTVGSGDPTYGLYTGLNAAPSWLNYSKTPTTSASSSTWLGSFANILNQVHMYLGVRNFEPNAFICDATTYFTAAGQGSDYVGAWDTPEFGPDAGGSRRHSRLRTNAVRRPDVLGHPALLRHEHGHHGDHEDRDRRGLLRVQAVPGHGVPDRHLRPGWHPLGPEPDRLPW